MKFEIDKDKMHYPNCISFKYKDHNLHLTKHNDNIELAICYDFNNKTDLNDSRKSILNNFCSKFNIKIIKDKILDNPFWKFYEVKCKWEQFIPIINKCVEENDLEWYSERLSDIPTDMLVKIIKRRKQINA